MRVAVIGAGMVGATTAMRLAALDTCREVVLVDIQPGLAEGVALDLNQSGPIQGLATRVIGATDYAATTNSDVIIITAGRPRSPGMSRSDLLRVNAGIVTDCVAKAASHSPFAILIVVTNPLDEMTYLAWRVSGFEPRRVLGMAGGLDSARLRWFLAEAARVPASRVEAVTLGSHGATMVPLLSRALVAGTPAAALLDPARLQRVVERTRGAGAEIVARLGRGSAYFAPSAATCAIARAVLEDRRETHPVCAYLKGEYGIDGVFVGVPALLGRRGVEAVQEIELDQSEFDQLQRAAASVRDAYATLEALPS